MNKKPLILFCSFLIFNGYAYTYSGDNLSKKFNEEKFVAITFDDGPSKNNTPEVLSILASNDAKATFFVVGSRAKQYPEIIRAIQEAGNEIANHSYSHKILTKASEVQIKSELTKTNTELKNNNISVKWFRPPYGIQDTKVARVAETLGLQTVLWTVDPQDWRGQSAETLKKQILDDVKSGDIVLLHDTKDNTREALQGLIRELQERDFKLVTLSELYQLKQNHSNSN